MVHFPQGITSLEKSRKVKTIQEVLMIITVQIAPPCPPEPSCLYPGFHKHHLLYSSVLHLGSLQKIPLFPCRLLEIEENRYSTTDSAFKKLRTLLLSTYLAPNLIFWAHEPQTWTNLVLVEEHEAWTQVHAKSSSQGGRRLGKGCHVIGLLKFLWSSHILTSHT